jgi:hypothetical protein
VDESDASEPNAGEPAASQPGREGRPPPGRPGNLHMVSDATGETVNSVARAVLSQFRDVEPVEHAWTLVRTRGHMEKVIAGIEAAPGPVLFTIIDERLRSHLTEACRRIGVPAISILDPVMHALVGYFDVATVGRPGLQHELSSEYFERIEAMNFAMAHDDGQQLETLNEADVVLTGVSRTSKTPTCIYLANRGVRAANVPLVPGVPPPPELLALKRPLVVGLTKDPARLVQIRRNRLRMMTERESDETDYADIEAVKREVAEARRLCSRMSWPTLDVTRRSIEETAAAILTLLSRHRRQAAS